MFRVLRDLLFELRPRRVIIHQELERFLRKPTMATIDAMPVNIRGRWTRFQLRAVIAANHVAASGMGLELRTVEITTFKDNVRWFLISPRCLRHDTVVSHNDACVECLKETSPR